VYNAADGRVLHTGPAPLDAWPNPPLVLDPQRLLVVEDCRLVALDRTTWEPAWTWDPPRWPSLTGEPPQTRLVKDQLLVGIRRNDCFEIERLESVHGRPLGEPIVVGREPIDLGAVSLDGERLYVANGNEVRTIDLRDGRVLRRVPLEPAGRWRIEPAAGGLILWTVPATSSFDAPRPGSVVVVPSEPERQRGKAANPSLALGPGPVRSVRIVGGELIVVTEGEVRGFRGVEREAK
jgi:hypothetical protein